MTDDRFPPRPSDDELIALFEASERDRLPAVSANPLNTDRLVSGVIAGIAARRKKRRTRRRWVGGGLIIALTGGGTVTWAALHRSPPAISFEIICADRASLASDGSLDANQAIITSNALPPVEQCREAWEAGSFEAFGTSRPPEDLASCVGTGGHALVVPGKDPETCMELGLLALDPATTTEGLAQISLQTQLSDYLVSVRCTDADTLTKFVDGALHAVGLEDWSVEYGNSPTAEQPCAAAMLLPHDQAVLIEHWPPLDSPTPTTE